MIIGADRFPLNEEQRHSITELAKTKADITYATIRKALKLSEDKLFNITYGEKTTSDTEKKTKFNYMRNYHLIKKAFGDSHKYLSAEQLNQIGYALSVYKEDKKISAYLAERGFAQQDIDVAITVPNLSGTGNLSIQACDKMLPYLEKGMMYNEACAAAGYNFKDDTEVAKLRYLPANEKAAPELGDIANPVVRRAISQTIKVVNAIIRNYDCSPCFIKVELARELAKNFDERKKLEKEQKENFAHNQQLIDSIKKCDGIQNPTGQDIIKLKLWQEQDGICPYSLQHIKREKLFEVGYVDIDHIIPYSICFDDSYKNKVLVLTAENRQKGNRLPMQYVSDKDKFVVWVTNSVRDRYKRAKLLKESYTEEDKKAWKERN
ncbi:MAG: type II CRISPR RNA-guided endonuclease Cas9, partial [Oscillospiraceae bacterium]